MAFIPVPSRVSKSLPKTDRTSLLPTATFTINSIMRGDMKPKVPEQHMASSYLAHPVDLHQSFLKDVLQWG